ncbi:MAG TPA: riboflavin synthase [Candidatus Omnitrophota bacterium]|nr:riboflavin synthase [Candidatus Omnitrophota bacterium]
MFTGIITNIGEVKKMVRTVTGMSVSVKCDAASLDAKKGDSIAVDGVCLTVTSSEKDIIIFDVVGNTLKKTGLSSLTSGDRVNMECAARMGDKMGGHMVSGHVDGVRAIKEFRKTSNGWILDIAVQGGDRSFLVPRGSVTIDGISLTVAEVYDNFFRVYVIPETIEATTLSSKRVGDRVNVEFDIMAKYAKQREQGVTEDKLRDAGFI